MRQLRIACLGDYIKYPSYFNIGVLEGSIRCGAWFRPIPIFGSSLDVVQEQIDFFKPHIMLTHCIFNRAPHNRDRVFDMLARARKRWGTFICYHMGDARKEPRYPHDISHIVDIGLVNNGELDRWSGIWHVPCYHWPYAALYQTEINSFDQRFESGVVFTGGLGGNEHHAARAGFVDQLKKEVPVKIYPDEQWGNSRFLTAEVAASSEAVLGFQMGGDIHGYEDVRPFQYIGAGALYFHNKHRNMDLFFNDGEHYVSFDGTAKGFCEAYRSIAGDHGKAHAIRAAGFDFCQKYHSTQRRMQLVIDIYSGKDPGNIIYLKDIEANREAI